MQTLSSAWRLVRSSSMQSSSNDIRNEAIEFEADSYRKLKSIQARLQKRTFQFLPQYGIAKVRPGKSPRPLVIAPIENRIVQRAILDVLQKHVPYVQSVLDVPTSFGGIKGKNVEKAISAINGIFSSGVTHYIRSDIPSFFTKVIRERVVSVLSSNIDDVHMMGLFTSAIETTLSNFSDLERRKLDLYFPLEHEGVAQGSPLSPLIANIYLSEFDREMNNDQIACVRYIDDFVILAKSEKSAAAGFRSAKAILKRQGLEAYSPDADPSKAGRGSIADGFDFLGCYIKPGLVQPSRNARKSILDKIDAEMNLACMLANFALSGNGSSGLGGGCYGQAISNINNIVWGWGKAFRFCTGSQVIEELDKKVSEKLDTFDRRIAKLLSRATHDQKRKIYGVRMLSLAMVGAS